MIIHPNGTRQLGPYDELPNLKGARTIYLDFETTSLDPSKKAINPWRRKHCKILGIAITVDDAPGAWYVPLRHWLYSASGGVNYHIENYGSIEGAMQWLGGILRDAVYWVNHSVKYDVHVLHNNGGFDVLSCDIELLDTLTKAKLYNSDMAYHGGYGLDNLAAKLLNSDISSYYEAMRPYLKQKIKCGKGWKVNQDYGLVPPDLMAPYAGQDVITCRDLDWFLEANMPERSLDVCNTELLLTKVLVDIERAGMPVDPIQINKEWAITYHKLLRLQEHIAKAVGIESFRPHVNEDCFELLCNRWGLPVLAWTDGQTDEEYYSAYTSPDDKKGQSAPHNPSFSKHALAAYANHTDLTPDQRDVAVAMLEYRKLNTRLDIFLTPYVELLGETGERVIHGTYNQCVRTGRMSCSDPNLQQLDSYVKSLIVPPEGYGIICTDAAAIEHRIITHYCRDAYLIKAYNDNPDLDPHQTMADLCHTTRRAGKTLNFGSGYGMGKKKLTRQLANDNSVMGEIWGEIDAAIAEGRLPPESRQAAFKQMAEVRAERIYNKYHESLPTLKPTSQEVARRCRQRGYTWDHYGRIRHLPREYAHIAFNTICQATAADIVKERTVALWWAMRDAGVPVQIIGQVHDALPMLSPAELALDVDLWRDIVRVLEQPARPLLVPVRWAIGGSLANWKAADLAAKDGGPSRTLPDVFTTDSVYF